MHRRSHLFALLALCLAAVLIPARASDPAQQFPDVIAAEVKARGEGVFDFDVTVSSPYDTAQRYADGFRVMDADGTVYGERTLWHDHANEQPFTRDLYGVKIPGKVPRVVIQARDKRLGYGGSTLQVALPR
jgi:hypothetical protein